MAIKQKKKEPRFLTKGCCGERKPLSLITIVEMEKGVRLLACTVCTEGAEATLEEVREVALAQADPPKPPSELVENARIFAHLTRCWHASA